MYWPVLQVWCLRACCAPVSSREGHLVPMNTKAATTIQAVGKLTIQESLKLSECISQDNCSSAICWLWFPSSELPETKKSRSEADYGGGSAIKLWLLQRISSISSTRKKMDIICSLYFTQWNTNLFVLPNSYSCNSGMFLSFRSNTDNLDNISRHKECLDSSNHHKKKRTIFTFENSFQFLWQKRRNSNNFHSSKYCSSSAGLVRSNSRRSSSFSRWYLDQIESLAQCPCRWSWTDTSEFPLF